MKSKLFALLVVVMLLAGCGKSGGISLGGSGSSSGVEGGGAGSSGVGGAAPHNPEPATVLLLGGGLAAYVMLRRKGKK